MFLEFKAVVKLEPEVVEAHVQQVITRSTVILASQLAGAKAFRCMLVYNELCQQRTQNQRFHFHGVEFHQDVLQCLRETYGWQESEDFNQMFKFTESYVCCTHVVACSIPNCQLELFERTFVFARFLINKI